MILNAFTRLGLFWLLAWSLLTPAHAEPLPEPLTFEAALNTASNPTHFELLQIEQQLQALRAELGIKQGEYGFSVDFIGRFREVGTSDYALPGDDDGDNAASLIVSKPLYDFGLQNSRESYLTLQLQALEYQKQMQIERRRLAIMEKYFAVLNADNDFISENEALAIGFIRYDNAVEDQELGLVSEIEVLRLQSEYELIRQKRSLAVHQQRLTRTILAEAMGYPDQLSSDLEIPRIDTQRKMPDNLEAMVTRALTHSPEAQLTNARTRAAHAAIGIADASNNPSLDLELEVSRYERDSRLRDDWRASLYFEIPIYSAASSDKVDFAQAKHRLALADQQQMQSHLRLEILELWQQIQQLQLKLQGHTIEQDYRDKYLDRSRAEYELEFKTDLGDSMVLYSRSNSQRLQSLYAFELAYQRLVALIGIDFMNQSTPSQ
ncbi:MAG: TolC family protein [Gammaproteobacteria bacterium]|nr:TolC family protein [Gammaproteobacteria bacterium]